MVQGLLALAADGAACYERAKAYSSDGVVTEVWR